jgi:hypothetical protein
MTMNVADGFKNELSFFYSSENGAAANIYSGLNATGSILATLDLPGNSSFVTSPTCFFTFYCPYSEVEGAFLGTAHSVYFNTDDLAIADINLELAAGSSPIGDMRA